MKTKKTNPKSILLFILALSFSISLNAQFKVVGYAPSWGSAPIQYSKLTHINYAFALPQYGGRLKAVDNPSYLQSIVSNAHANNVKVFIAIGGWSDNGVPIDPVFESIGGDAASRANFINDALYIVNTYNLDGVDVDWEYPDQGNSSTNFTTLMRELSNALKPKGKGLSFAGPAESYSAAGINSAVFQYVDFVNIMAYDGPGANHSTYQFAVDGLNLYKSKGCPANKCVIGVPFYARPSWRSYADLVASGANPNADWFGSEAYNGIPTIKQKTEMALRDAAGIMIWALSQDASGANSLLSAINDVVKSSNNNNNNNSGDTNLGGTYKLQNRHSGIYLDINAASTADGARVQQWTGNSCTCQNFVFTHLGNGVYEILAQHSGKSLDVSAISNSDGAAIVQWPYWGGANQKFKAMATGDGFYKLVAQNSGKIIEVGGWSTTPGGIVQQWTDNGQASGQWKLVPVNNTNFSTTIQAENFGAMSGIQTEGTTDAGGGSNVGYIDNGDWMAYFNINFPTSGSYTVEYRVASINGGRLSLDLNAGAVQLGAVNIPATGGWQNWTTVTQTINVNAGTYHVGVFSQTGGWNFNWFKITKNNGAKMEQVDTENISSNYNLSEAFNVMPNPVLQELTISAPFDIVGSSMQLINGMGSEVYNTTLTNTTIDVSNLQGGIYTLIINKDGNKILKRFVKQ